MSGSCSGLWEVSESGCGKLCLIFFREAAWLNREERRSSGAGEVEPAFGFREVLAIATVMCAVRLCCVKIDGKGGDLRQLWYCRVAQPPCVLVV